MKKILLFLIFISSVQNTFSQSEGLLNETFNLKYLKVGDLYYTPNGENPDLTINENSGVYSFEANGIANMLFGSVYFNENSITIEPEGVTLADCLQSNCYYENMYFYEILSNYFMESKNLTYQYSEINGIKTLKLHDSNYNIAYFSTATNPNPEPRLFQTWYLYMTELDMDDPIFYEGVNSPQITINSDMIYTGVDGCAIINGDFIVAQGDEFSDFILQSRNYETDESNCSEGSPIYAMEELEWSEPLRARLYQGNNGLDYFEYEFYAGFISHFRNQRLSVSKNNFINVNIYPNPAKDKIFFNSNMNGLNAVSIMDINGRVVISKTDGSLTEVNISNLISGMYFIRIESSSGNITKKFIKN